MTTRFLLLSQLYGVTVQLLRRLRFDVIATCGCNSNLLDLVNSVAQSEQGQIPLGHLANNSVDSRP